MTVHCPYCNAANQAGAGFCLDCGEPFAGDGPAAAQEVLRPADRGRRAWQRWGGRWGVVLGPLLVGLIVFSAWWGDQDRRQTAYRRGLSDLHDHHWAGAITDFRIAGDFSDAALRLRDTTQFSTTLQGYVVAADQAVQDGAWWDAAVALRQLAAADPYYPEVHGRLAAARSLAGRIIYRIPHGPDAGLWYAEADGSDPRRFPAPANASIHGISPDSRWAVYTVYQFYPWPPGRHDLAVVDLYTGQTYQAPLAPADEPKADAVRFRADSSGFWWVTGRAWWYYDFVTQRLTPIPAPVLAADAGHGRLLLGVVAQPTPSGEPRTQLALADAVGAPLVTLPPENGLVGAAQFSADGLAILYSVQERVGESWAERLVARSRDGMSLLGLRVRGGSVASPEPIQGVLPLGPNGAPLSLIDWPGQPPFLINPSRPISVDLTGAPDPLGIGSVPLTATALHLGAGLRALQVPPAEVGLALTVQATTRTGLAVEWLGWAQHGTRVLYRAPSVGGGLGLYSVPLRDPPPTGPDGLPQDGVRLLGRAADRYAWARNTALSHDGTHLLAVLAAGALAGPPGSPPNAAGLWALRAGGGGATLVAAAATEFWTPDGWLPPPTE